MEISKEMLIEAFKYIDNEANVCWSGDWSLKRNNMDDMSYLCWEYFKDVKHLKLNKSETIYRRGYTLLNWGGVREKIEEYGLRNLWKEVREKS